MKASIAALIQSMEEAKADWAGFSKISPDNARVERIARYLCAAEGNEPDTVTMGRIAWNGQPVPHAIGAKGTIAIQPVQPQWVLYISDARAAIAAVKAADEPAEKA